MRELMESVPQLTEQRERMGLGEQREEKPDFVVSGDEGD